MRSAPIRRAAALIAPMVAAATLALAPGLPAAFAATAGGTRISGATLGYGP